MIRDEENPMPEIDNRDTVILAQRAEIEKLRAELGKSAEISRGYFYCVLYTFAAAIIIFLGFLPTYMSVWLCGKLGYIPEFSDKFGGMIERIAQNSILVIVAVAIVPTIHQKYKLLFKTVVVAFFAFLAVVFYKSSFISSSNDNIERSVTIGVQTWQLALCWLFEFVVCRDSYCKQIRRFLTFCFSSILFIRTDHDD
jgi:uncharacterized protein YkvS